MAQPLAFRIRPTQLSDVVGQDHLVKPGGLLFELLRHRNLPSMIFYGPPGSGKTTVATIMASTMKKTYRLINAVTSTKKDLDSLYAEARLSNGIVLIIDEVHRLNKDKQDTLLPYIEEGLITMIGATTANPFYAINPAIRSRTHLIEFHALDAKAIEELLNKALREDPFLNTSLIISEPQLHLIAAQSNGDGRYALNVLELLAQTYPDQSISMTQLKSLSITPNHGGDKDSDGHYDLLSAFQKSIRGSDVDASLYYLARLIQMDDLDAIERRLLVIAYEDIGLANVSLCSRVIAAIDSAKRVGFPEARIALSVIVIELALSPKSKSAEAAIDKARQIVENSAGRVPPYLQYSPVSLDEDEKYDYDRADLWHRLQYLPDSLKNQRFYTPQNLNSNEKIFKQNLDELKKIKRSSDMRALKKK